MTMLHVRRPNSTKKKKKKVKIRSRKKEKVVQHRKNWPRDLQGWVKRKKEKKSKPPQNAMQVIFLKFEEFYPVFRTLELVFKIFVSSKVNFNYAFLY